MAEEVPSKRQKISKKSSEPNPLISRTEKCRVCDEPAAIHIHYGAITCFSCRAFFRRSIQNHSSESYRCRKDSDCNISLKSRKSCQKCRFEKCIRIGMKSNWVLTDEERIHRFRKHRERHDQQSQRGSFCELQNLEQDDFHRRSCQTSPEQDERASPQSSRSFGEGDLDAYNQPNYFHGRQTSPTLTFRSLSSPDSPMDLKNQTNFKPELDCDPLPMFRALAVDFSNKTDATQRLDTVKSITFPMKSQFDDSLLPDHLGPNMNLVEPLDLKVNTSYSSQQENSTLLPNRFLDEPTMHDEQEVSDEQQYRGLALIGGYMPQVSVDEFSQIQSISRIHDVNYKSISFGEELIKEMVMSSVFKIPLSPSATMTAYRLMIQRVTRVAQGLDTFVKLPHKIQSMLLKQNADLIVSLRGAVFFEKRKGGLDQILISMGVDDLGAAMNMVTSAVKTKNLQRIDYSTFNSLQKVSNNETEKRYNELLEHVGVTMSFDMDLVKILSYVLLFTTNPEECDSPELREVANMREQMIGMMQRYVLGRYQKETSSRLLPGVLRCIADLQELTWIKKQRQLASTSSTKSAEEFARINDPQKQLHFNS